MAGLPTGTVTFLFTDIEGSTRLLQQLGNRYAEVLATHHRLLRSAIQEAHGHEMDVHGDALFVVFPRAKDALLAAVAAQRAISSHPWPAGVAVRVRMGLHTGEALGTDAGYVGMDVHRAARIGAAGHGGQILLSQTTRDLVGKDLPHRVTLRDLGEHRLRDISHPERLFQVVAADLPADFPSLRTPDMLPNNLPIQLTSFIGREREAEVKRFFTTTRLLTLTGSGGAGKTRLALEVAGEVLDQYPDGVWLVELASLADPALVPQAVASALGIRDESARPVLAVLIDHLKLKHLLLVLDNCEHLLIACSQLAEALLRTCSNLRILATSREGFGVAGQLAYRVPSLSLPDAPEPSLRRLMQSEAARLFIERAAFSQPGFRISQKNATALVQVCQRLDGIPLAIELAAARVKVLAVEQIAARLDDRFGLLTGGSRTALPRQQTLRATMDWSYDLLSEKERVLLRRLSVFSGAWTLEAAVAVCSGDGVAAADILDLQMQLVDKSLVSVEMQGGEARYRLLETVHQYGQDKLLEAGEAEKVRGRHLDFFLKLAEEAEPKLQGGEQAVWLNRLEAAHDNLRAALGWSVQGTPETGVRLAGALWRFWVARGHITEGRRWLSEALKRSRGGAAALRARTLHGAGYLATLQNDYSEARTLYDESLALYRHLGDTRGTAATIVGLGNSFRRQGDYMAARPYIEESLAIYRELGERQDIATALADLGHDLWHQEEYAAAQSALEESLSISRELGLKGTLVYLLWSLGLVAFDRHDHQKARAHYEESLVIAKGIGDTRYVAHSVEAFATLTAAGGEPKRAARLLGAAEAFRERIRLPLAPAHRNDYDRPIAAIRATLSDEAFAATWAEGRAMTLEQAIEYALETPPGESNV